MLALREAHARARSEPSFVEPDPRPELARLAEQFPGSLREIDRLALDVIRRRIAALVHAERDATALEPWMRAQIVFHAEARGALAAKRWLAGRREITAELRSAFVREQRDASYLADELEAIATPPRGRLMGLVFARVARALAITPAEARALVWE